MNVLVRLDGSRNGVGGFSRTVLAATLALGVYGLPGTAQSMEPGSIRPEIDIGVQPKGETDASTDADGEASTSGQWSVGLGLGLASSPRYAGSDERQTALAPFVSINYGMFYLIPMELGVQYATDYGTSFQVGIAYGRGRAEKRKSGGIFGGSGSDKLAGMGEVKGSTLINLKLSQDVTDWLAVDLGGEFAVAGQKHQGNQYTAGISLRPWMTDTDQIEVGVTTHLGDKDYNKTYFGVTPEQALRSRYGQFNAESGAYASSVEASWTHVIDKHWSTIATAEYLQYSKKIKKSPIVLDSSGVTAIVGINYTF